MSMLLLQSSIEKAFVDRLRHLLPLFCNSSYINYANHRFPCKRILKIKTNFTWYDGFTLGLSKFFILSQLARKILFTSEVIKSDTALGEEGVKVFFVSLSRLKYLYALRWAWGRKGCQKLFNLIKNNT
jgi:hypothetical protein